MEKNIFSMRNRRIIVLLLLFIYTLYIAYIVVNIDIIHWLLYAFGNDVHLISITLLLFLPTYVFAMYEGQRKTFIITLSIVLLIVWSFRGMLTNTEDLCAFAGLYSYYKETGSIPYKNLYIIEFLVFFSLWSFVNCFCKLNYISNTISLIIVLFCATSMLISGLMNSSSVCPNTTKSCSYKIPSEPVYVRLDQKEEYVCVDIGSDKDFLNNIVSFRTPIDDLFKISFYLLSNDSIYLPPKDSAKIEILSGNVNYQRIPTGEYLQFDFYTSPFSVFKYSKERVVLYKRPIPL